MSSTDYSMTRAAWSLTGATPIPAVSRIMSLAMCRLLGFLFAPRIRDRRDKPLYILLRIKVRPGLAALVAGVIHLRVITDHWSEFSICKYLIKLNEGSE